MFFQEKIGVTPSVAAPGDTHPSAATGRTIRASHTVILFRYDDVFSGVTKVGITQGGKVGKLMMLPYFFLKNLATFLVVVL